MPEQNFYAPITWGNSELEFTDIIYSKADGIAKITINRPQVRNAFRPHTVNEMMQALNDARYDNKIGVIILTGQGELAFVQAVIKVYVVIRVTKMKWVGITLMC